MPGWAGGCPKMMVPTMKSQRKYPIPPPGGGEFTEKETQSSPVSILVYNYQSLITLNKQKANELTYEHLKGSMSSVK